MRQEDREALKRWQHFSRAFDASAEGDVFETDAERIARVRVLEEDFYRWAKYYFPGVCRSEFAKWHKRYCNYLIAADHNINMAVAMVCRDMAKSSVTALVVLYLYYVKKDFKSLGMFSHSADQAIGLLSPIKRAIESNQRLQRDYGSRVSLGKWQAHSFRTTDGVSFAAFGAGQTPRGEKDSDTAHRFDFLLFDDFDHPEVCMNPDRLDKHWKYVTGDVFPAMHVSGRKRVVFLNNKIDEDCIIQRAWDHAKGIKGSLCITVNLVNGNGRSNWPEAYTDDECKGMIHLAEDEAQTEYFNNPVKRGTTFQKDWMRFKKMPPLSSYKLMVAYLDGGFKKSKTADTKALVLIGLHDGEYHIRKVYVDNCSIETMIGWHYDLEKWLLSHNGTCVWWMEEVFLLSLLHDHFDAAIKTHGHRIPVQGDKRKKPDKDLRIANTAGYFERGKVYFDQALEQDAFVKRLISQYLRFKVGVSGNEKDGPDAVEGGIHKLNEMTADMNGGIIVGKRFQSSKRI
jgi:hypothetical protein